MDILEYLNELNAQEQIDKLVTRYKDKKVVLYGAGEFFQTLQKHFDLSGLNIVGICDKKFELSKDTNPSGYKALTPEELKEFDFDVILVSLYRNFVVYDYLEYQLLTNTPNEDKPVLPLIVPTLLMRKKEYIEGSCALEKLLKDYKFTTVLDLGCGDGYFADSFLNAGKIVTAIDYGKSVYFENNNHKSLKTIIADFNTYNFNQKFDCIWCSHVLEHQLNVNTFLKKIYDLLNDDGVLAITVPPLKSQIVGGNVTLWNAGILLYNLILAGFDCSNASVKSINYDISVIVKKSKKVNLDAIVYDAGDIKKLRKYFPRDLEFSRTYADTPFEGNIEELNW